MERNISEREKKLAAMRLADAKTKLLIYNPFYGRLILKLKFTFARCGTAATDMKKIIFDPEFVLRLSEKELDFVLKHEILHCVLGHCTRGKGKDKRLFNIACDIVVNSNIMSTLINHLITIDGVEPMHLAPDNKEGLLYSAEEVYEMLLAEEETNKPEGESSGIDVRDNTIDNHDIWEVTEYDAVTEQVWKQSINEALRCAGSTDLSPCVRKLMKDYAHKPVVNWKVVLNEFIKKVNDKYDYTFAPPDRRFSSSDFIFPSYNEITEEIINNIWFVVDTSASISEGELATVFSEITSAINQFKYLEGLLSFFDTSVTNPLRFNDIDSLYNIQPVGGGGTSFACIFDYMSERLTEKLPTAVIVMTDGYAPYPEEKVALGIPVLWVIVGEGNRDSDAPFGVTIHI